MKVELRLPATVENLQVLSEAFFRLHWNIGEIGKVPPVWSDRYTLKKGLMPNHDKQGIFAFVVQDKTVSYVGVATARGGERYQGHGLGARFSKYVRVRDEGEYKAVDQRLADAGGVVTLGFDREHAYLANALELFLIGRLDTQHNSNRPG